LSQTVAPRFNIRECGRSRLGVKPLRDVRTRLVYHDCNVLSLRDQLSVAALNNLTVVLLCLDHEQKLVHEGSHSPRWTRLIQRRHVEDNVVKIARLHIWHHVEEFFQAQLRRPAGGRRPHCSEVEIVGSGSDGVGWLKSFVQRISRLTLKK